MSDTLARLYATYGVIALMERYNHPIELDLISCYMRIERKLPGFTDVTLIRLPCNSERHH